VSIEEVMLIYVYMYIYKIYILQLLKKKINLHVCTFIPVLMTSYCHRFRC